MRVLETSFPPRRAFLPASNTHAGEVLWTYRIWGIGNSWPIWHTLSMGQCAKKRHRFTSEILSVLKETLRGLEGLKMISPDDPSVAPLRQDLQKKINELEGNSDAHPDHKAAA